MNDKTASRKSFIINVMYYALVVVIIYAVFKHVIPNILPFILAFLLVNLLNPIVKKLQARFAIKRTAVSVILMILFYIVVGAALFLLVFNILLFIWKFAVNISDTYYPEIIKPTLTNMWSNISEYIDDLPPDWQVVANNFQADMMQQIQKFAVGLAPALLSLISGITRSIPRFFIAFLFTIMLSFFISIHYEKVTTFLEAQLSPKTLNLISEVKKIIRNTVVNYLGALLVMMGVTCLEMIVGLSIMRIEHAFIVGIGIALLDALPVFGTGTVLIPWAIINVIEGDFKRAAGLVILYLVAVVVRNIIEPKIVGDKLGMNPIITMVSIYIGFRLIGVLGMIFIPILAQILIQLHMAGTIKLYNSTEEMTPELTQSDK